MAEPTEVSEERPTLLLFRQTAPQNIAMACKEMNPIYSSADCFTQSWEYPKCGNRDT